MIEDVYHARVTLLGPLHIDTLGALENKLIIQWELDRATGSADLHELDRLLLDRLRGQGPAHPNTRITLANLIRRQLGDGTSTVAEKLGGPASLPEGTARDRVRLDGDHVEAEVDLQLGAIVLQQSRV